MRLDTIVVGKNIRCNSRMPPLCGGIAILDGRVAAILHEDAALEARSDAHTIIDAGEHLVLPGLIDGHVHLRDPGQTHKEDFASGTRAAAAGGITTVIAQPNTTPEIADAAVFDEVRRTGEQRACVDFGIAARLDLARPQEAAKLAAAGAACFDLATNTCTASDLVAMLALAAPLPLSVGCYCEDAALSAHAAHKARDAGTPVTDAFLAGLPDEAETAAVAHLWYLARHLGVRLLLRQISCATTLDFLENARRDSAVAVAVEGNPHHLHLTHEDTRRIGPAAKIKPPLRSQRDNEALWSALARGSVDLVGTDHAPHAPSEKDRKFEEAPPGFAGLETLLPVLLNGVAEGRMPIERLISAACEFPARWFGIADRKGSLVPGADADLIIIDQASRRAPDAASLQTKSGDTPFAGIPLTGWPITTMVRGTVIWEGGRPCQADACGRHLPARFARAQ